MEEKDFMEIIYRILFAFAGVVMIAIRIYYQIRSRRYRKEARMRDRFFLVLPGLLAAIVSVSFGGCYIFAPHWFPWSYADYPRWLRLSGLLLLIGGLALLGEAHHHLDKNFNSFVAVREGQTLVQSGPYHWIRHPIYTAYLLNCLGGGLLSASLVLTFAPFLLYWTMFLLRVGQEEQAMLDTFGERYAAYMRRTGRFLPRLRIRH